MDFLALNLTTSSIVLIIGFAFFIWGCFAGLPRIFTIVCATVILCLASPNGFVHSIINSFSEGSAKTFGQYLMPFIGGTCLGTAMVATGCASKIGQYLMEKLGRKSAVAIIMLVTFLISAAGVTGFAGVFIILPIALSVCRAADIPRGVGLIAFSSILQLTSFNLIGIPSLPNILPTEIMGVSLYEVPGLSLSMFVVGCILTVIICFHFSKKGNFEVEPEVNYYSTPDVREENMMPSFGISIFPVIFIILGTYILNSVFKLNAAFSAIVPQILMAIFVTIACKKTWMTKENESKLKHLIRSVEDIFPLLCIVALIGGFGAVASSLLSYDAAIKSLLQLHVNPYLCAFLVVAGICFITSDAIAGIALFNATMAQNFIGIAGINNGALHRIVVSTACTFDSLPMAATANNFVMLFGYTMKSGYKYFFYGTVVITTITSLIAVVVSSIAWPV